MNMNIPIRMNIVGKTVLTLRVQARRPNATQFRYKMIDVNTVRNFA